ncbi:lysine biosynthesis enzyme LysX [Candidatus Roizmanbacteria bacterium RIFCSPHIGHO2_01_FULL_39_8]|uniref:Lysine biosynthesis enzyme LysX n=2 Tax=Candidatus Roizmaniibacteriota TaxID=1752723 RepID=A0A1F7GHM1_9BACT|nr:MAG: lysine biosynthesis enzyme LysX [Candidatus Roizmanbacteria bacterium RIFCSPHIGHO2_01_FULL_39_8]OGK35316.1 MAG: lysine biosynthesis enzyme LysX [Candidatus Roizmanbacteria bacterium RIFCSPHIGHO2_12_FULL_39_8]
MKSIALLHSTIRGDEKLILEAARRKDVDMKIIDVRTEVLDPYRYEADFDLVLERCISTVKGTHATRFYEAIGIPVINSGTVAAICEDKFLTSLTLLKHKVPTVEFVMVFSLEQALKAIRDMGGFPVIFKPSLGSWGRLLSKVNDIDALETVIEHKDVLGSPQQKAFYIQRYVEKPGRDIRSFVVDGKAICAIYRDSPHWITNTARGGKASNCPITKDLSKISRQASDAVGGGILAMDIFETEEGLKINEINHTMEFKNSEAPTGVSISGAIVDYCIQTLKKL